MLMQNLGGQTKSIMVFSEVAYNAAFFPLQKSIKSRPKNRYYRKLMGRVPSQIETSGLWTVDRVRYFSNIQKLTVKFKILADLLLPEALKGCLFLQENELSLFTVNGNWSDWGKWGDCTVTCGGGTRKRNRACTNPAPENGGLDCEGSNKEEEPCNNIPCPSKPYLFKYVKQ